MPEAGQWISTIIRSRWSYEINLAAEAEAPQWGAKQPQPDITCRIEPKNVILPSAGAGKPPVALSQLDANPSLNVMGDAAEQSLPAYILDFEDAGGVEHTCRASSDEGYPRLNPTAHAVSNRRSLRESMGILGFMLIALVESVILILRKRDSDPQ